VRECALRLVSFAKANNLPVFIVGHVTKEGSIAGPKILEHMVDTVLSLEGERFAGLRLVRTTKNRFGPTDEVGVFEMKEEGLLPIVDTTGIFIEKSDSDKPGACFTIALEGTRPMLVEIQALVTGTPLPSPRRVASGVDHNRVLTISATLQKRLNLPLYKEDVYVSVAAGLRLSEPAVDLAIALAILSSFRNRALPKNSVAFGEIDLLGNVRRVAGLEKRIKEAKQLGFKNILSSETLPSLSDFKL
jgi:DNA repair protein RadA/Sms